MSVKKKFSKKNTNYVWIKPLGENLLISFIPQKGYFINSSSYIADMFFEGLKQNEEKLCLNLEEVYLEDG